MIEKNCPSDISGDFEKSSGPLSPVDLGISEIDFVWEELPKFISSLSRSEITEFLVHSSSRKSELVSQDVSTNVIRRAERISNLVLT